MAELVGKYATDGATGRKSASPGEELFSRFREAFETIDFTALNTIVVRFDWNMFEGTAVAVTAREAKARMVEAMKEGAFCRGDYHLARFLALLYLGVRLRQGVSYRLVDLAAISNARFLQWTLYFSAQHTAVA